MQEDYLHYLWKYKLLDLSDVYTVNNAKIEVLDWGMHNLNSGPDFFNAKVKIGNTLWVGNIEMHLKSSDWNAHKHYNDKAYDNVILHVVYEHDKAILTNNNREIETIELKDVLNYTKYSEYLSFVAKPIPCLDSLESLPAINLVAFKEKMLLERLERKSIFLQEKLSATNYDWEEAFYQNIASSMGMKVNSIPFEILAQNTPIKTLQKVNDINQVEAILLGQAGFFETPHENQHVLAWSKEYDYQKIKYNLTPLNKSIWKFSKLRPPNFPTVRIAQLARLIVSQGNLFDRLIKQKASLKEINLIFEVKLNEGFWLTHYSLDKESKSIIKSIGKTLVESIIINTIVPFLFVYGKYNQNESYVDYAFKLLEELDPENNSITSKFEGKIKNKSANDSQALIEGYNFYCAKKKCLSCSIGVTLLTH